MSNTDIPLQNVYEVVSQVRSRPIGIPVETWSEHWKIPLSEEVNQRLLGGGTRSKHPRHTCERPDIGGRMCERRLVVVFLPMLAKRNRHGGERTLLPIVPCLAAEACGETRP